MSSSRTCRPGARWTNWAFPAEVHDQIIELALEQTELSPRELAVRFKSRPSPLRSHFSQSSGSNRFPKFAILFGVIDFVQSLAQCTLPRDPERLTGRYDAIMAT